MYIPGWVLWQGNPLPPPSVCIAFLQVKQFKYFSNFSISLWIYFTYLRLRQRLLLRSQFLPAPEYRFFLKLYCRGNNFKKSTKSWPFKVLCTRGAYYVPYSFLFISNNFCNGGSAPAGWLSSLMHLSGPMGVIKFLYSPAPPLPTVWALKPPLWASWSSLGPKWYSHVGLMPFHWAQKTIDFQGPTTSTCPRNGYARMGL